MVQLDCFCRAPLVLLDVSILRCYIGASSVEPHRGCND